MIRRILNNGSAVVMLCLLFFWSCNSGRGVWRITAVELKTGGCRRDVFECSENRLKYGKWNQYRATRYLIANMGDAHAQRGPSYNVYCEQLEQLYQRQSVNIFLLREFNDSLFATGDFFPDLVKQFDKDCVSVEYLNNRVEDALQQWRVSPFARKLGFRDFCEYLLPYRFGTEEIEEWWTDYRKYYGAVLDSVVLHPGVSLAEFCNAVNEFVPEPHTYSRYPETKPGLRPSLLKHIVGGSCDDYSALTTFLCRSYGIPVAAEFTPQWGNHSQGHSWCALLQGDSSYHYMVGEPLFLAREKPFTWKLVKAYRRTASPQRRAPGRGASAGELPAWLCNPRLLDVTKLYCDVTELKVRDLRREGRTRRVVLCCFDDKDWKPVSAARRRGNQVTFPDVGYPSVFLPTYYGGAVISPAQWPVLVDKNGQAWLLEPEVDQPRTVRLTRKFMDLRARQFLDSLRGGRFEFADNKMFKNAYSIAIPDTVGMNYQTLPVDGGRDYRYVRFVAAVGTPGNIAEIELYDKYGVKLTGSVIGNYRLPGASRVMKNAFDGEPLTFTSCLPSQEDAWVGLDLGQSVEISKVCYLPRSDDNFIREGEEYELCYWDGDGWASLGRQIGSRATQELVYDNVPTNALLLLHNHTKGKEERIFTYEDGRQVWW